MVNVVKHKEKIPSDGTRKMFGIIRNKENFQNSVETFLTFSTGEMTKGLLNHKKQAELGRDKALIQSRCLTRLL